MNLFVRVSLCGAIALLSLECCQAAGGRRPRTGVVGTFGTLNSVQARRAPAQQSRRTQWSGSGRRGGASDLGGVPGMSGGVGGGGLPGIAGGAGAKSMTASSGSTGMSSSAPRQGSPSNLTGQRRTIKRANLGSSVRSSLPPANSQR